MIRLQCSLVDSSGRKDTLGHCLLDVRFIQHGRSAAKFRPLSGTKPGVLKPQVKLSLEYKDDDSENSVRNEQSFVSTATDDCFILDPNGDIYTLIVVLASGNEMELELEPGKQYMLGFNVFDQLITTERFSRSFPLVPEDLVLNVKASQGKLNEFLGSLDPFTIYLKSGEDIEAEGAADASMLLQRQQLDTWIDLEWLSSNKRVEGAVHLKLKVSKASGDDDNTWHQYRLSFDLHSIQMFEQTSQIYGSYVYPAFGNHSPVYTLPPVMIRPPSPSKRRHISVMERLNNGFNAYEFVFDPQQVQQILADCPLIVEVWQRKDNEKDKMAGKCYLSLDKLLSPEERVKRFNGTIVYARDRTIDILGPEEGFEGEEHFKKICGYLRVIIALEDFGSIESGDIHLANTEEEEVAIANVVELPLQQEQDQETSAWKHEEKKKFTRKLATVKLTHAQALETAAKNQQQDTLSHFANSQAQAESLSDLLEGLMIEVKKRGAAVAKLETELQIRHTAFEETHRNRLKDLDGANKRYAKELNHALAKAKADTDVVKVQVQLEKEKRLRIEKDIEQVRREIRQLSSSKQSSDKELLALELKQLESEVKKLRSIEKKHEKARDAANTKLKKVIKYTELMKHKRIEFMRSKVDQKQAQLSQMRIQKLMKDELEDLKKDREEIRSLRDLINKAMHQSYVKKVREQKKQSTSNIIPVIKQESRPSSRPPTFPEHDSFEEDTWDEDVTSISDEDELVIQALNPK